MPSAAACPSRLLGASSVLQFCSGGSAKASFKETEEKIAKFLYHRARFDTPVLSVLRYAALHCKYRYKVLCTPKAECLGANRLARARVDSDGASFHVENIEQNHSRRQDSSEI